MDVSYQGDFERGAQACERALEAAEDDDPAPRALARSVLALMLELQGGHRIAAAKACASRAAAEFEALTDAQLAGQLDLPYQLGLVDTLLERYEQAARHLERGISVALACANSQFIGSTRAFLGYCLFYLGRLDEALPVADEAVESGRLLRVPAVSAWALATAAWTWSVVDTREAMRLGEEGLAELGQVDDSMMADTTHGHFALVCADAGEYERCIDHLQLAGAPQLRSFRRARPQVPVGRSARSVDARHGPARARHANGRSAESSSPPAWGSGVRRASACRGRALVLLAEGHADGAAELALRGRAPPPQAAPGSRPAARGSSPARAGRRRAAAIGPSRSSAPCGARWRRAGAPARAGGRARAANAGRQRAAAVARRRGDAGTTQLSRRQREVATLVAAGNSNPEIAAALFLSPKTVEGHMRRIFEKLASPPAPRSPPRSPGRRRRRSLRTLETCPGSRPSCSLRPRSARASARSSTPSGSSSPTSRPSTGGRCCSGCCSSGSTSRCALARSSTACGPPIRPSVIQWRRIWGAYFAAVGFNNVVPARGGDLIKLFLTRSSIPGSSYPTVAAAFFVESVFDVTVGVLRADLRLHAGRLSEAAGLLEAGLLRHLLLGRALPLHAVPDHGPGDLALVAFAVLSVRARRSGRACARA